MAVMKTKMGHLLEVTKQWKPWLQLTRLLIWLLSSPCAKLFSENWIPTSCHNFYPEAMQWDHVSNFILRIAIHWLCLHISTNNCAWSLATGRLKIYPTFSWNKQQCTFIPYWSLEDSLQIWLKVSFRHPGKLSDWAPASPGNIYEFSKYISIYLTPTWLTHTWEACWKAQIQLLCSTSELPPPRYRDVKCQVNSIVCLCQVLQNSFDHIEPVSDVHEGCLSFWYLLCHGD